MEEWKEFCIGLLEGVNNRVVNNRMERERERVVKEEEVKRSLSRKEVLEAVNKLKDGKAMGLDSIPEEAWRYGEEKVREWIWRFCDKKRGGKG